MFGKLFEKRSSNEANDGLEYTNLLDFFKGDDTSSLRNTTYLKCLNYLSSYIAKLSIDVVKNTEEGTLPTKHYLNNLIKLQPNQYQSAFDMMKATILTYKHRGIVGIYIDRDIITGKIKGLYNVEITGITIDNAGIIFPNKQNCVLVDFVSCGNSYSCFDKDIIILRDNSLNGLDNFFSCKGKASDVLNSNIKAQKYQNEMFDNGLTNKIAIQMSSDIKDKKEIAKIAEKFENIYTSNKRMFTIPAGYTVSPLNLKLSDSQFLELKNESKQDICSTLGVPYSIVKNGVLTEEEQTSFLNDTVQPILIQIEQEFNRKLLFEKDINKGLRIKFNVASILRCSPEKQAEIINKYITCGVYTINEARKILGQKTIEFGDVPLFASGQVPLNLLVTGKASYVDEDTPIDNTNKDENNNNDNSNKEGDNDNE